jgi:hypothetical protein
MPRRRRLVRPARLLPPVQPCRGRRRRRLGRAPAPACSLQCQQGRARVGHRRRPVPPPPFHQPAISGLRTPLSRTQLSKNLRRSIWFEGWGTGAGFVQGASSSLAWPGGRTPRLRPASGREDHSASTPRRRTAHYSFRVPLANPLRSHHVPGGWLQGPLNYLVTSDSGSIAHRPLPCLPRPHRA